MNQLIIVLLIARVRTIIIECSCSQLLSQSDCIQRTSMNCKWDTITSSCGKIIQSNTTNSTTIITTSITYCRLQTQCASIEGCSFVNDECIPFSGCSAYVKTTTKECQSVSVQCVSDGKYCVDMSDCSSYFTEQSCIKSNSGVFCYWLESQCVQADTCDKLPITLISDAQCRAQLSNCTLKNGGGCIESGTNCSDQVNENQCYWNANMETQCIWNQTCMDKTCDNASITLITDSECQKILTTCTTKEGGGCQTRGECSIYTIQSACVKSISNEDCYWNGSSCVIKICTNAPETYITNQLCEDFISGCITNGKGCVINQNCSAAIVEVACVHSNGIDCIWDGTCKNKTCANAPSSNNTYELCQLYLSECTNLTTGGCQQKSCNNAPITLISNAECENYLTNCITKQGGGCTTLTTCNAINTEVGCIKDISGNLCYWNINICQDRTCNNAPVTLKTYEECQQYSSSCTISQNGCVNLSCNVLQTSDYCLINGCQWRNKCYQKECGLASKTIITFSGCNSYSDKCTLDNSGQGCMNIPHNCGGITKQEGCQLFTNLKCGWLKSKCVTQTCETAPLSYATTCDSYLSGCVTNNNATGCMKQLTNCSDRKQKLNCEYGNCVWYNNQCLIKNCQTAIFTTYNAVNCNTYLYGCIANNNNDGCMLKISCSTLSQLNCVDSDCYYDGSQCIEKICDNIKLTTHQDCQAVLNTCTSNGTTCLSLQQKCSDYTEQACHFTPTNLCTWKNQQCRDFACTDIESPADDATCISYSKSCTLLATPTQFLNCSSKLASCSSYQLNQCSATLGSTYHNCQLVNGICTQPIINCATIILTAYSKSTCEAANSTCTVNSISTQCIIKKSLCSLYTTNEDCSYATEGQCMFVGQTCYIKSVKCSTFSSTDCKQAYSYCKENGNKCGVIDCTLITGVSTEEQCQSYDETCYLDATFNSCNIGLTICKGATKNKCTTNTLSSLKCVWITDNTNNQLCVTLTPNVNCQFIDKTDISLTKCESMSNNECSFSAAGKCIQKQENCSEYQIQEECIKSSINYCNYNNTTKCTDLTSTTACNEMAFGYTIPADLCTLINPLCINSKANGCQDKNCSDITGSNITQQICSNYLSTCIVNNKGNGCIIQQMTCSKYSAADCTFSSVDGICIVINNQCVKKTCEQKTDANTSADCENYLWDCTLQKLTDVKTCTTRQDCNTYIQQSQCLYNSKGEQCYWNTVLNICVIQVCENIQYTTYKLCESVQCTINQNNTFCMQRVACSDYTTNAQCVIGLNNEICGWDRVSQKCTSNITCFTAETSITTHESCQKYLPQCTVFNNGGCIPLKQDCSLYLYEQQCLITTTGECVWINQQCTDKSCSTADSTYDSYEKCQTYFDGCTVNQLGQGCVIQPLTCEDMSKNQCVLDNCFWDTNNLLCITKTCSNALLDIYNEQTCNTYLTGCTIFVDQMCQPTICEDYAYTTDSQCLKAITHCTTNGQKCVTRGLCEAANEYGCVTQSDGQECAWYGNQCLIKTCYTASISLTSEITCNNYKQGCTTQLNGGCRPKLTCQYANVEAACTTDSSGKMCVWDNGICRNKDCRDLIGSTLDICQKQGCTKGSNGKCAVLTLCSEYQNKDSCLIGTDSPCLWIDGACYSYIECSSIPWTTDTECKKISDQCTTNGQTCVSITTCSQTNTNGGCVTGIDGDCIQTITELGSDILKCTPFTSCTDALYLTHEECQSASPRCTTDGINGCIQLLKCTQYKSQISCRLDKDGELVILDAILSTGICSWSNGKCRDQICTDLSGSTPDECYNQLSFCTSDGTSCLQKSNCNQYDNQGACTTSVGFDGQCFWQEAITLGADSYCRLLACTDLIGTSAIECQSKLSICTFDGTKCISKDQCSNYKTLIACHQNGNDGICYWDSTTCNLLQSCITTDMIACKYASDRCYQNTTCIAHTCDTYYRTTGKCTYFPNFNASSLSICTLSNNTCSVANISQLTNLNCYQTTAYQYTWNGKNCTSCTPQTTETNSTSSSLLLILIFIMNI